MKVGVFGNLRYEHLAEVLRAVANRGRALGLELCSEEALDAAWPETVPILDLGRPPEVILTLGGDGTLLRAARNTAHLQIPIIGVNLGRVGFLTTATPADLDLALTAIATRSLRIEYRKTLIATLHGPDGEARPLPVALNDVVIHKEGVARLVRLRVSLGGEEVGVYSADGLIVATPTGSTAYSLSAGGPIVVPGVDAFVISPICAHTLGVRPLVIASSAEILIEPLRPGAEHLMVSVDGQQATPLEPTSRAVIRRGPYDVPLAWLAGVRYFRRVRETLRWGDIADREILP